MSHRRIVSSLTPCLAEVEVCRVSLCGAQWVQAGNGMPVLEMAEDPAMFVFARSF